MSVDSSNVPLGGNPAAFSTPVSLGRPIVRLLVHYNPFYLLSACCMMIGIVVLNNGLDWSPLPTQSLLLLIVTLNLYELALVGIGVLLVRRGVIRDGLFVLILEAFFLADAGFLNMEIFTADPQLGLAVNVILLLLAVAKLAAIVFIGLRLRPGLGLLAVAAGQLIILYATPGLFAHLAFDESQRRGELSPWAIYLGWWVFALMPILGVMLRASFRDRWEMLLPMTRIVGKSLIAMPAVSMFAHLCLANWVYEVPFHVANLAPLLLGMAVLRGHWDAVPETRALRARLQFTLPLWAIAFSLLVPDALLIDLGGGWMISPLRIVLFAAALVYLDGWWNLRYAPFLAASLACAGVAALGASFEQMAENITAGARKLIDFFRKFVPQSSSQWGVTSVAAAFVLLAIGAVVSWLGRALCLVPAGIEPHSRRSEDDDVRHIPIDRD